jgi:Conserved hypothetical protein (Lin0512_fam)
MRRPVGKDGGVISPALVPCIRTALNGETMAKKRMVLEIGMGTDIRGADPTKAACRALRDALWHNSLSIATALGHPLDAMSARVEEQKSDSGNVPRGPHHCGATCFSRLLLVRS